MSSESARAIGARLLLALLPISASLALGCTTPLAPSMAPTAGTTPTEQPHPKGRQAIHDRSRLEEALREARSLSEMAVLEDIETGNAGHADAQEGYAVEGAPELTSRGITILDGNDLMAEALREARSLSDENSADTTWGRISRARGAIREITDTEEARTARLHLARSLDRFSSRLEAADHPSSTWAPFARAALEELDHVLTRPERADPHTTSWARGYRAGLLLRLGEDEAAVPENDAALLDALAAGSPALTARWSAQRGHILLKANHLEEALAAFRSARAAFGSVGAETSTSERLTLSKQILLPLADLLLRPDGEDQSRLHEVQRSLEEIRLAEVAEFFGDACLAGRPSRRLESIPGTVVLYPIVFPDRLELIIGKADRLYRRTVWDGIEAPFEWLRRFRLSLQDPTRLRYRGPAARFYDWLIRPLGDLRPGDGETLVLVPTLEWMGLPIAALWNEREERFLVEEMAVAITPGLELRSPSPIAVERARLLAAGLTTEVEGFAQLPNVVLEVDSVSDAFNGQQMIGKSYTTATLKDAFASGKFDIVHIASHGVFDESSEDGFLVTSDGRLGIDELADVIRTTRFDQDTRLELLVLSACETAVSSPRAAFGLAGVAIRSGAGSAVGSLWRVSDRATASLFRRFYEELAREGVSRAEALRRAQRSLREDPSSTHPFYWSPFILINDWL